ncbi:tigger transposable element-derived protein 4-like [Rhizophagus irregularis DAOM 181602=DAOM 197198]|nr:tigger transposable element-derived protein 4-like [Rhizophagus irregularis DAOM 181602=DAOM 197198]
MHGEAANDLDTMREEFVEFLKNINNVYNITLKFLPPNTTAHLQPCDQGNICNFKVQYLKLYLQIRVKAYDNFNE